MKSAAGHQNITFTVCMYIHTHTHNAIYIYIRKRTVYSRHSYVYIFNRADRCPKLLYQPEESSVFIQLGSVYRTGQLYTHSALSLSFCNRQSLKFSSVSSVSVIYLYTWNREQFYRKVKHISIKYAKLKFLLANCGPFFQTRKPMACCVKIVR